MKQVWSGARISRRAAAGLMLSALLGGCETMERLEAAPPDASKDAKVLGIPNARFYLSAPAAMEEEQRLSLLREAKALGKGPGATLPVAYLLSLSGGGDDGAFGAGLLCGWSQHGDRPEFKLVTGVSTGALIAPFAFLGPEYDDRLKAVYTDVTPADIYIARPPLMGALVNDSMADSTPLYNTISRYLDEGMLRRIAEEYGKGRLLLIQTTDLDASRPVIWNIGAIAASGHPESLTLVRKILLGSASIPGVFPPVMLDVDVDGQKMQEMHVDGGTVSQAFLIPPSVNAHKALAQSGFRRTAVAYVIRNARLDVNFDQIQRQTIPIAGRAVATLINYNGVGDLYREYLVTETNHIAFNLAYISNEFHAEHKVPFEQSYMRALFAYGFDKAKDGYPWTHQPPGFKGAKG